VRLGPGGGNWRCGERDAAAGVGKSGDGAGGRGGGFGVFGTLCGLEWCFVVASVYVEC